MIPLCKQLRRWVRALGWDIVRYRPLWPTLLGVERLPIRTVLDIGAYDGDTARVFRRFFPQAHIYCVEPQPEPVQALNAWATSQQGFVHVLPFALGNHTGTDEIHRRAHEPRVASLVSFAAIHDAAAATILTAQVPVRRLDEVVSAHVDLRDGVLVKIDAEGSERAILEGGNATLRRSTACILEFHGFPRFEGQLAFEEALPMLSGLGLEYAGILQQQLRRNGRLNYFDALFVNWTRGESAAPESEARSWGKEQHATLSSLR